MGSSPKSRRLLAVGLMVVASMVVSASPAMAAATPANAKFTPVKRYDVLKKLVYPVVGISKFWDGFGGCRDGCKREHHGIDIVTYGYKGLPVVAAHDGTVTTVTYDKGNAGCSVRIKGKDRWETRYLHLNNDLPGTDQVGATCPAAGITVGAKVKAGQIIGYIGDSGNAENTVPHLHFELRNRSGYPIDPYRSLRKARRVVFEWLPTDIQDVTIALSETVHRDGSTAAVVVAKGEFESVASSERLSASYASPVIAVDKSDPGPALAEIARIGPSSIIVMSNDPPRWLLNLVKPLSPIVEVTNIPTIDMPELFFAPDTDTSTVNNPTDRFPTVIAGAVHRIWRGYQDEYEDYIYEHRSVVLAGERYAPKHLGQKAGSWPGKYADSDVLWWITGEGWVSTTSIDDVPDPGCAYLTEKRALPWTLTFLGSSAELAPMPVWKSS